MSVPHRRLSARGILRARPRLYSSIFLSCLVIALSPTGLKLPVRFLIGWDTGITIYLLLAFTMMARSSQQTIRRRAIQHRAVGEYRGEFAVGRAG